MIRVFIGPRLRKTVARLGAEVTTDTEAVLRAVAEGFGTPHKHAGTGLRKLGRCSFEARVGLKWRVVFIQEADGLTAYDVMSHDEVRQWLKSRRGD